MDRFVDSSAKLGRGVLVGRYAIIEAGVSIGDGACIGDYVKILRGSVIGPGVTISDGAVVGKMPGFAVTSTQRAGAPAPVFIGPHSSIGTLAVVCAGSSIGAEVFLGDRSLVRENCRVGDRTVIGAGVVVENDVRVGRECKIQTGAYITAHTLLEDRVFIAPMVVTTNDNYMGRTAKRLGSKKGPLIKRGARIGGGAVLLPGVTIAEETFIAAGALVACDTRPGRLYMGVPARDTRPVPREEYLEQGDDSEHSAG